MINNLWNKTNTFLSIAAIIVTIFIAWYFNHDKTTSLNIEEVNATMLTQDLDIEGLTIQYLFRDSIEVKNLWKTLFTIKNTGEQSLYGKGFSDINVKDGIIPLVVNDCNVVLNVNMTNNNNGCILNNKGELIVTQWKPNEFVEIELLTEGEKAPTLQINPRLIKDVNITYSTYTPSNINITPKIIDKFPTTLKNIIKWAIVVIMIIMIIGAITQMPSQLKGKPASVKISTIFLWCFVLFIIVCPLLWMF